jgi:3-phenylpropionate/cinnamic acid dioxygenase small subunit
VSDDRGPEERGWRDNELKRMLRRRIARIRTEVAMGKHPTKKMDGIGRLIERDEDGK